MESPDHTESLKRFRERFQRSEATTDHLEALKAFLTSELTLAYQEGVKDGESTKNGVERYQLGYRDGERDAEERVWKHCRELINAVRVEPPRDADDEFRYQIKKLWVEEAKNALIARIDSRKV